MGKQIGWTEDEDGRMVPVPVFSKTFNRQTMNELMPILLAEAYQPDVDEDGEIPEKEKRYQGKPLGHVILERRMHEAAAGNHEIAKDMLDRILGKPVQQTQNTNVNITLSDHLKNIHDNNENDVFDLDMPGVVIEAEYSESNDDDEWDEISKSL